MNSRSGQKKKVTGVQIREVISSVAETVEEGRTKRKQARGGRWKTEGVKIPNHHWFV